jgi:D-methionine transport system permease protein
MHEFLSNLSVYREAIRQTLYIVLISTVVGGLLGLGIGLLLYGSCDPSVGA